MRDEPNNTDSHVSDRRQLSNAVADNRNELFGEGLRERKKRLTRQLISDTATMMFLERGFDEVKVTDVAEECGVSEKTIYNYFPTKESLLLDREDATAADIRRALGPNSASTPVEAMVSILKVNLDEFTSYWDEADLPDMTAMRRFTDLVESTPSLRAAEAEMMRRLGQVAAETMAERAGVDPDEPEPQIAADALIGLWRVYHAAVVRYADDQHSPQQVRDLVLSDVQRAARLLDSGLWSFGMVVNGNDGREAMRVANDSADQTRTQVIQAIKQARDAWFQLKSDIKEHSREERDAMKDVKNATREQMRQAALDFKHGVHASKQDFARARRDVMRDRDRARGQAIQNWDRARRERGPRRPPGPDS